MKNTGILAAVALLAVSACGPQVPSAAVAGSGIISSYRNGSEAVVLYQESSTSEYQLNAEAESMCGAVGKTAGPRSDQPSNSKIPGVDAKAVFVCY